MSLISMRNVISPFTNKVHLITIVLVSLLFGLFRLSSGTIRVIPRGESAGRPQLSEPENNRSVNDLNKNRPGLDLGDAATTADVDPRGEIARLAGQKNTATGRAPNSAHTNESRDDVIGEMIGAKSKPEKAVPDRKNRAEPGGLSDIEKTLGLR